MAACFGTGTVPVRFPADVSGHQARLIVYNRCFIAVTRRLTSNARLVELFSQQARLLDRAADSCQVCAQGSTARLQSNLLQQHCRIVKKFCSRNAGTQGCICMTAKQTSRKTAANASPVSDSKVRDVADARKPLVQRMLVSNTSLPHFPASS